MCHGKSIESQAAELDRPGFRCFGGEPELCDLLHDPIALALMAADKVDSSDVYALLHKARGAAVSTR
ncbi:MAG TPA: hypothetical protein VGR70_20720 [Stellaceae bacterium]|nr:hypothetical protein [Stellaceae bacterium]